MSTQGWLPVKAAEAYAMTAKQLIHHTFPWEIAPAIPVGGCSLPPGEIPLPRKVEAA